MALVPTASKSKTTPKEPNIPSAAQKTLAAMEKKLAAAQAKLSATKDSRLPAAESSKRKAVGDFPVPAQKQSRMNMKYEGAPAQPSVASSYAYDGYSTLPLASRHDLTYFSQPVRFDAPEQEYLRSLVQFSSLRTHRLEDENRTRVNIRENRAENLHEEDVRRRWKFEEDKQEAERRQAVARMEHEQARALQDDQFRRQMLMMSFTADQEWKNKMLQMAAEKEGFAHIERMLDKRNHPQLMALTLHHNNDNQGCEKQEHGDATPNMYE